MIDQWNEGKEAAEAGVEFWANPYSGLSDSKEKFHAWFAGWCYGKRKPYNAIE